MAKKQKNIVFILPDQMRADFVGCYGADFARTPNIDKLASEGVRYSRAISPSPLCVPARASLLTGHNSLANGVLHNSVWLRPDHEECGQNSWAKILSQKGYETCAVGKMHFYPWDIMEGFDKRIISEDKRHIAVEDDYFNALAEVGLKKYHGLSCEGYLENKGCMDNPLPKEWQADTWITKKSCEYIAEQTGDKPFALMVGYVSPHCPYDADKDDAELFNEEDMPKSRQNTPESDEFFEMMRASNLSPWCGIDYKGITEAQKAKIRKYYSGLIHRVDAGVGEIVATLKEKGLYEDTVVIFSSDHGDFVGDYDMMGKHLFYEPSIHVPLIVRDSANEAGKINDNIACLTDVRATILNIAGVENAETMDSKILSCYAETDEERGVFGASDIGYMYCTTKWKYCRYHNGQVQLFDMLNDPDETQNLAYKPETIEIMREMDKGLHEVLAKSAVMGHEEKLVNCGAKGYTKRGWQRPYPFK